MFGKPLEKKVSNKKTIKYKKEKETQGRLDTGVRFAQEVR